MSPKVSSCFLESFLGTPESFLFSMWKFPAYKIGNWTMQPRTNIGKQEFPRVETLGVCFLDRKRPISSLFPRRVGL